MNDEGLVAKAKTGDKDALINLIMTNRDDYYRLALVHTGDPDDAMDALQDMTVILYQNISRLHKDTAFKAWSMTILVNCCRRITRQRKKMAWLDEIKEAVLPPSRQLEQQIDVQAALEKLSLPQREAVKLKYLLDMDYETMAKILKIPVGTAKSRAFNGLRNLKNMMGGSASE